MSAGPYVFVKQLINLLYRIGLKINQHVPTKNNIKSFLIHYGVHKIDLLKRNALS